MSQARLIIAILGAISINFMTGCTDRPSTSGGKSVLPVIATPSPRVISPIALSSSRITDGSSTVSSCNLETVNGTLSENATVEVRRDRPVKISGWLIDETSLKVPDNVQLRLQSASGDGAWEQSVSHWLDRYDVAEARGKEFLSSGFMVEMNLSNLPVGNYGFYLAFEGENGEIACGVGRQLMVVD